MQLVSGPIFIGGCPRSGTTALWNALIKHPNLGPAPDKYQDKELWFMAEFFAGRSETETGRRAHPLDIQFERETATFIDEFMRRHTGSPTGRYVTAYCDNILYTDKLVHLLPEVKVLLLIRHPQDNVWSLLNAFFSSYIRRNRSADLITEDEIVRATEIWKRAARVVLQAMDGKLGPSVLVVRQEQMILEPDVVARSVLDFVGEPFEQAVSDALAFGIINSSFPPGREPSEKSFLEVIPVPDDKARQDFFDRNRRKLVQSPLLCSVVRTHAATEMRLLGYEDHAASIAPGDSNQTGEQPVPSLPQRTAELQEVAVLDATGKVQDSFAQAAQITVRVTAQANQDIANPSVSFVVRDAEGVSIFGTTTFDEGMRLPNLAAGQQLTVQFTFLAALHTGRYSVCASLNSVSRPDYSDNILHHQIDQAAWFDVAYSQQRPVHYKCFVPVAIGIANGQHAISAMNPPPDKSPTVPVAPSRT